MSSECVELNELVSALADGELTGAEKERVERHLADCAECRAFVSACRRIDRTVGEGLEPPAVEPARWQAMLAQLKAAGRPREAPRRARIRPAKAVAFVSTLAAACLLAVAVFMPWDTPGPIIRDDQVQHVEMDSATSEYEVVTVAAPEGGLSMMVIIDTDAEEEEAPEKKSGGEPEGGEK